MAAAVESPSVDSPKQQNNDEKWKAVERLILVQAVYKFGKDDWQLVSKTLREHPLLKRHGNVFSEKACSAKFASILKEDNLNANELPSELEKLRKAVLKVAKRLWDDRMSEVQELIKKEEERFKTLVLEIDEIRAGKWDDKLLAAVDAQQAKRLKLDLEKEQPAQVIKSAEKPKDEPRPAEAKATQDSKTKSVQQQPNEDVEMKDAEPEETAKVETQESPTDVAAAEHHEVTEEPKSSSEKPVPLPSADLVEESGEENDEVDQVAGVKVSDEPQRPSTRQRRSSRRNINEDDAAEDEGSTVPPSIQEEREDNEDNEDEQEAEAIEDDAVDEPTPKPRRGRPRKSDIKAETPSRKKEESAAAAAATPTRSTRASRNRSPTKEEDAEDNEAEEEVEEEEVEEEEEEAQEPSSPPKKSTPVPAKRSFSGTASPGVSKKFQQLINIVWRDISNHRFGGVFQQPIREQDASGYYEIVKRPMDLKTIKGKIRDGLITNSSQFHRDILLMLANAHMYNKPGTPVADMTQEIYQHAEEQIRNFMDTESIIENHRGKTADREEAEDEEVEEEESAPRAKRKRLL